MSGIYSKLYQNPPKLEIVKDPKMVIFEMVSCMCDNRSILKFTKREDGEYSFNSPGRNGSFGNSLSNFQFEFPIHEIVWEAAEQNWKGVIRMINSGTSQIESVKSK